MEAPPLRAELAMALDLLSDASVVEAVDVIDKAAVASKLRKGLRLVQEMTERATAAELPQPAGESTTRDDSVRPSQVRFEADAGEVWSSRSRPTCRSRLRRGCCRPGRERLA